MKKIIIAFSAIVFTFAIITSLNSAIGNGTTTNVPSDSALGPLCGYGSTYLGQEWAPYGYLPCMTPQGDVFRQVGICTNQVWGGCVADECKPPCYVVWP